MDGSELVWANGGGNDAAMRIFEPNSPDQMSFEIEYAVDGGDIPGTDVAGGVEFDLPQTD